MSLKAPHLRERWYWKQIGWFVLALNAVYTVFYFLMKAGHLSTRSFDRCLTWFGALGFAACALWTNDRLQKKNQKLEAEKSA